MNGITIYEFDMLTAAPDFTCAGSLHTVPASVFEWLEIQCLRTADKDGAPWLRLTQRQGRRAVQMTSFVGVVRTPDGYQIEVLPKVGKMLGGNYGEARDLLIEMLCCLQGFRHVQTARAKLLWEIFITEFLNTVEHVVKRGLRSDYLPNTDNLSALRGKLLMAPHLRQNLCRADRFFAEFDEFSPNRPENRLLHAALSATLLHSTSQTNQQLARELCFVFADVPVSTQPWLDFQRIRMDRDMGYYSDALAWARLILEDEAPLTGTGKHTAPSLLFPMEAVFEAFVARHLSRQLVRPLTLKRLKPDLVVRDAGRDVLVLDTKWKLLDSLKSNGSDKYGLSQGDFYQLQAYGQSYLNGKGDVVLIYPKTAAFGQPLPVFEFCQPEGLQLWVLPFCLKSRMLLVPEEAPFKDAIKRADRVTLYGSPSR